MRGTKPARCHRCSLPITVAQRMRTRRIIVIERGDAKLRPIHGHCGKGIE